MALLNYMKMELELKCLINVILLVIHSRQYFFI